MKKDFEISVSTYPIVMCRVILPSDSLVERKSKNKKQFINLRTSVLTVKTEKKQFTITAHKDYCFDGATIPFGIGKGNMKLLYPALFHDIMCDNKWVINYDRQLADTIFLKLLLMHHVNPFIAYIMFICVEIYQLFRNWRKN